MNGVPVLCPKCEKTTLVIKPGDKYYCLNSVCLYQGRLPTDHKFECEANVDHYRYYVRQLEREVLDARGISQQSFRFGNVDGIPSDDIKVLIVDKDKYKFIGVDEGIGDSFHFEVTYDRCTGQLLQFTPTDLSKKLHSK